MAMYVPRNMQGAGEQDDDDDLSRLIDQCASLKIQDGNSDVITLYCTSDGNKSVKVHKSILAQSSPVFATMIVNAEMKQTIVLEIVNVKYDVLVEMLRYIYSGKFWNIGGLKIVELAVAADTYALNGLKNMCEETLIKTLNHSNANAYLEAADRLFMLELRGKALELIVGNLREVFLQTPGMRSLPPEIIANILDQSLVANSRIYDDLKRALGVLEDEISYD